MTTPAQTLEQKVKGLIEALHAADADGIARFFEPDAKAYFLQRPGNWSGAELIGAGFAKVVAEKGRSWTIDRMITDEARHAVVFEWTQLEPGVPTLHGVDWVVFAKDTLRVTEIRSYLAPPQ